MNRVLTNTEFFTFENEVWLRTASGSMRVMQESDYEIVNDIVNHISSFYPKAHEALCDEYRGSAINIPYYRYRIATRFIRCNFSALDSIPDISSDLHFNLEQITCPLRGECKYDNIICRPQFNHRLSPAENRVMALVYEGLSEEAIGDRLKLSPLTVHTHIRNSYTRLEIHSKAEFIKYASYHHLFS